MLAAYLCVGILTAGMNGTMATLGFARSPYVLNNIRSVGLRPWTVYPLCALKAAGALGLLAGIVLPELGVAAAGGLTLFFVGAIAAHVRARALTTIPFPGAFLILAIASLALALANS